MESLLLAALALCCFPPSLAQQTTNCAVWHIEQLEDYFADPSCTDVELVRDLYLGDWLRKPEPVVVNGDKTVFGGMRGHKTILDLDFLVTMGPKRGNYSVWGLLVNRFRTDDAHPPALMTFQNVHFVNVKIDQLHEIHGAEYLSFAYIKCIVHGYFDHGNTGFYSNATAPYPIVARNENVSIFRESGAGSSDTHLHDRDIVLRYAFNEPGFVKAAVSYIVPREYFKQEWNVRTGEDLSQMLASFQEPAKVAQALEIPIESRIVITDEDCDNWLLTMSKSVSTIIFAGIPYEPDFHLHRPALVFNNNHKCSFPDGMSVKFQNLILEICGGNSLLPIVVTHEHQLVLENVTIKFCSRGNFKTRIDALIRGDGNSRSNECCSDPQMSREKPGCSAMCDNICYLNGPVMNLDGGCWRNVTSGIIKGNSNGIDAIHFIWICGLLLLLSCVLLVLVAQRKSRFRSQQCKRLRLIDGRKVKVYTGFLGKGSSGEVLEAAMYDKESKAYKPAAAKIIDLALIPGHADEIKQYAVQEVEKLQMCDYPNIVKCFGFCREESPPDLQFIILYERLPQTLNNLIFRNDEFFEECTYKQLLNIFLGIASGLSYMQSEWNMIHFDLKPENVLLTEDKIPKIIDFGHVRECSGRSISLTRRKGTIGYIAPEAELPGQRVNKSVDVFSLGVLMWECIMRRRVVHQHPACSDEPIVMYRAGQPVPVLWNGPPELKTLIERCVQFDPDLFLLNQENADIAAQTYGRPTIATVKHELENMMNEPWVENQPPAWQSQE